MRPVKPEGQADDHKADGQNPELPVGASAMDGVTEPQGPASVSQSQKSLETKLEDLRAEFVRNSLVERQLRARAAQRAADARAEAFDALTRASDSDVQRQQAEQERAEARAEASSALARAGDADARREQAERERDQARTEALAARAEASSALARAADADVRREQAERESVQARAETSSARAEASNALAHAADADGRREQAERELAEVSERNLRLESTLRDTAATLNSLQKLGVLRRVYQRFGERRHVKLIRNSPLFDAAWYVQRYPEVVTSGLDPAYDFLCNAVPLGRNPGPRFDSSWYLLRHPDVAQKRINPLLHYILFGAAEGREIRPAECQPTGLPNK